MKVAVVGRTGALLSSANALVNAGHQIPLIWTTQEESYYDAGVDAYQSFADSVGAKYFNTRKINEDTTIDVIRSSKCDVAISVNWPTLIGAPILCCFEFGILNAHLGDLPRFRGNACPNWAILTGENKIGLCIHKMGRELDTGPIVLRDEFPLLLTTYIEEVYQWFDVRLPSMFVEAVEGLAGGTLIPAPQPTNPSLALRCYPRRPGDARIDWNSKSETIVRLVRASSRPFDGAFTSLEGDEEIKIWRAEAVNHLGGFLAVPGQVCYRLDDDPVIAATDGMVRLLEIEFHDGVSGPEANERVLKSLRNRLI